MSQPSTTSTTHFWLKREAVPLTLEAVSALDDEAARLFLAELRWGSRMHWTCIGIYPTNFNPMSKANIEKLSKRGEQLTRCLVDTYAPEL
ncbi:MAG: hypothetical protein Q8L44_08750 [Sulfuritalea sp.]|nr:hypothetical protein [Sulfuritalea sp.]